MLNGQLVHLVDVSRKLGCRCVCVVCAHPLVAKKGAIRRHHFAHLRETDCHGAPETALHLLSKELMSQLSTFAIPSYIFLISDIPKPAE